jgi:hypothetical protein
MGNILHIEGLLRFTTQSNSPVWNIDLSDKDDDFNYQIIASTHIVPCLIETAQPPNQTDETPNRLPAFRNLTVQSNTQTGIRFVLDYASVEGFKSMFYAIDAYVNFEVKIN